MSLPEGALVGPSSASGRPLGPPRDQPPLRTKEEIHVCNSHDFDSEDEAILTRDGPSSFHSMISDLSCHSHKLEYVSSANPVEAEAFSSLRRATVRTLSGEQLLRGQTSGPLWFGDPATGYTIAYVFRLADLHARGRQRYYALLALAGSDAHRAFEACTLIWSLFEQIATHIVRMAEQVALRKTMEHSPMERGQITPISSFLTGRTMDPDGFPRQGVSNVRANGIAQLVDNENFFCELHMMFVNILQELGRMLGGMRVRPIEAELPREEHDKATKKILKVNYEDGIAQQNQTEQDKTISCRPHLLEERRSEDTQTPKCPTLLCSPIMTAHCQQVAF